MEYGSNSRDDDNPARERSNANVLTTVTGSWVAVFILAALFNIVAAVMALFILKPMRIRTIGH